jgi:hypothetical protein
LCLRAAFPVHFFVKLDNTSKDILWNSTHTVIPTAATGHFCVESQNEQDLRFLA